MSRASYLWLEQFPSYQLQQTLKCYTYISFSTIADSWEIALAKDIQVSTHDAHSCTAKKTIYIQKMEFQRPSGPVRPLVLEIARFLNIVRFKYYEFNSILIIKLILTDLFYNYFQFNFKCKIQNVISVMAARRQFCYQINQFIFYYSPQ